MSPILSFLKMSVDVVVTSTGAGEEPKKPVKDADVNKIVSVFKWRRITFSNGKTDEKWHNGIDITAKSEITQVKIYAAYSGTVKFIGVPKGNSLNSGYGYRETVEKIKFVRIEK